VFEEVVMQISAKVLIALAGVVLVASAQDADSLEIVFSGDPDGARSVEDLAGSLLTADDLGTGWAVERPADGAMDPAGAELAETGIVTQASAKMLPRFELCPEADPEARAVARDLRWQAFRAFAFVVDDPIQPPDDLEGHIVFFQEFLLTAAPHEIEATFELLADGWGACLGPIEAGREGPGEVASMPVPDIGDDRIGVLVLVEEAGAWAQWRIHNVLVRDGDVLALFSLGEIAAGVEPSITETHVAEIARLGVDAF
jgi:hypothetical protein